MFLINKVTNTVTKTVPYREVAKSTNRFNQGLLTPCQFP